MRVVTRRALAGTAVVGVVLIAGLLIGRVVTNPVHAQDSGYEGAFLEWYGPFGITQGETARFSYSNFALQGAVQVEWAFSDALTGEMIVGNFGKPGRLPAMKGVVWDFKGDHLKEGERLQLVGWLRITYPSTQVRKGAVDLGSIEVFDSMTSQTRFFVAANPAAPGDDKYLQLDPDVKR